MRKIKLAACYGFCGGVRRALEILRESVAKYGAPVYCMPEIVHNLRVVDDMKKLGVIFIKSLDEMTDMTRPLVLSAHGTAMSVKNEIARRNIKAIDAVCPVVAQVHNLARTQAAAGAKIIVIGENRNHDEIIGTMGQADEMFFASNADDVAALPLDADCKIAWVSQTTLRADFVADIAAAIRARFPNAVGNNNICMATTERQNAIRELAKESDVVIIIGSPTSSNCKKLRDVAGQHCDRVYMADFAGDIKAEWLAGAESIGITASASTGDEAVKEIAEFITNREQ